MNAVQFEMEMMDPTDYWALHREGWHLSATLAEGMHLPALQEFYKELEDAATDVLGHFGVCLN